MALGIELKKGNRLIGTVGLHAIDWIHRRGMTGSFIGPRALRGRGLGTEAKTLLIDHAFADLGMESIWSFVVADNVASLRALEKQGYQRNGIFRHSALVDGQWKDCIYFDLLRSEWELARGRKQVAAETRRVRRTGR
jgi:RimJ/RimL family protein N-acetyltransferase